MSNFTDEGKQTTILHRLFQNSIFITALLVVPLVFMSLFSQRTRPVTRAQQINIGIAYLILIIVTYWIVRHFAHYSLRTKLIIMFLAVTFIITQPLFFLSRSSIRTTLIESANQKLLAAASETGASIDGFIQNEKRTVREEAGLLGVEGGITTIEDMVRDPEAQDEMVAHLKAYRDRSPLTIISYAILDLNGRPILEVPEMSGQENESARPYFTVPLETEQPYVSPVLFSDSGKPFLFFSSIIRNSEGDVIGVLRSQHKATVLQELVAENTGLAGEQSFAVLFDENHLHLAHGTAPNVIYQLVAPLDGTQLTALQSDGRLPDLPMDELATDLPQLADNLQNARNNPFFEAKDVATGSIINQTAVTYLKTQPWQVAFFQPQEVFLAPVQIQSRSILLFTVLIAIFVAFLAIMLSQLLARPLIQLSEIATKVAQGDLTIKADVRAKDEIGTLSTAFNSMTDRLQDLIANLESRIDARTRALVTSSEIGRSLSRILDKEQLVKEVVTQVQSAFDYYYAQIYLFDETGKILTLAGGSGEAGQKMLAKGHKLESSQGLVGRAAATNQVVLIPDVSENNEWLANPLLPETKAEIAVPIATGEQVLGVLDVQHRIENGLAQEDADLLLSIAHQVAIALQNARLLENVRQQAEQEIKLNHIAQQIQSTQTVDEALQIAVREIGRAVGSPQTAVWLTNRSGTENGNSVRGQDD